MRNSTSVPAPSSLQRSMFPPMRSARSRIPGKPQCPASPSWPSTLGSMPLPSSRIQRDHRARTGKDQEPQLRPGHLSHTARHLIPILHGPRKGDGARKTGDRDGLPPTAIPVLFGQSIQMPGASLGSGGQNCGLNPLYQNRWTALGATGPEASILSKLKRGKKLAPPKDEGAAKRH